MPYGRKTERVVVVRTDADGNILDYDVVEQLSPPVMGEKLSSSKLKKSKTFSEGYADTEKRSFKEEETSSIGRDSSRKKRRDSPARSPGQSRDSAARTPEQRDDSAPRTPRRRRVRYVRPKSTVKIFDEKIDWHADPRIDAHNEEAIRILQNAVPKKIFREKLDWHVKPRIDAHNEEAIEQIKSAGKPVIYDEKLSWPSARRIDSQNEEYLKHKEREKSLIRERTRIPNFPQDRRKENRPRIDHINPEYEEYRQRRKSARLPPIEDRKLVWHKAPRIDQQNDDYIERMRQKRSEPAIFREKLEWRTRTAKIDHHNEQYTEAVKDRTRPRILNQLPRWRSQPKIESHNDSYDPNAHEKPIIHSEKLRWHARPRIDTGLEPESDEHEYDENNFEDNTNHYNNVDENDYVMV